MEQFCKEVLQFLKSEYKDAYIYNLELSKDLFLSSKAELRINIDSTFTIKITNCVMNYLFTLYRNNIYSEERHRYKWQNELVKLIEN